MYIKISDRHADNTKMLEVREFEYRGVRIPTHKLEIAELGLKLAKEIEFFGLFQCDENEKAGAVILKLPTKEGYRAIIAIECSIYVMGADGKTIDIIRY